MRAVVARKDMHHVHVDVSRKHVFKITFGRFDEPQLEPQLSAVYPCLIEGRQVSQGHVIDPQSFTQIASIFASPCKMQVSLFATSIKS